MRKFQLRPSSESEPGDRFDSPSEVWTDIGVDDEDGREWLASESGLAEDVVKRLLEPVPASYWRRFGMGLHFNVRTTSMEGGSSTIADFGIWLEPGRVITVRRGGALVLDRAAEACSYGAGPSHAWGLILFLVLESLDGVEQNLSELIATIDDLEDEVLSAEGRPPIQHIADLQNRLIYARRFRTPLTNMVSFISSQPTSVIDEDVRNEFESIAYVVAQHQAVLDLSIDRASALQGLIRDQMADSMSAATYRFTWVATVFLPLSFLTGLLGINVAGIPGDHNPLAFWVVCGALCVVAGAWGILVGRFTNELQRPRDSRDR